MTESATPSTEPLTPSAAAGPLVATAGRYYRNARYLMVLGLLIMGGFFLYDGFKGWPRLNEQIDKVAAAIETVPPGSEDWTRLDQQRTALGAKKSDTSIGLQKVLGFGLPVLAAVYLMYFISKSRGEIRLENDILTVPGHPPVPLGSITSIDQRIWKKKGISVLKYDVDGKKGAITLDDFVYQQTPIDAMYDKIVAHATSQSA